MAETDLAQIRARHKHAMEYGFLPYWEAETGNLEILVRDDVPELLAEVERLRSALQEMEKRFGTDRLHPH